jgi:hypothetical protein
VWLVKGWLGVEKSLAILALPFYPGAGFASREAARAWVARFVGWYIGARRLHTVLERLLDDLLYNAPISARRRSRPPGQRPRAPRVAGG